mmetsp:Transcript_2142/g.3075  ORF Transcript_2142/g.3075 Transcript_2142/m.3075 type:complete len:215 (+) Transcript_2142:1260-1904(+)|eukprot:CAMPEP_0178897420 /NCGR_PEP_ID=MMETSP0786-20121207/1737_1 /TAXON_ID=186022 /ORGANISM="Thalassionema frauenfeldii, Strain CCMP 1798" /LENGTH=214 /DNA_ID=CAMNT_0020567969 /DNA_START=2411 /DNA_END=3055 /DNA_ORIENTATION=+
MAPSAVPLTEAPIAPPTGMPTASPTTEAPVVPPTEMPSIQTTESPLAPPSGVPTKVPTTESPIVPPTGVPVVPGTPEPSLLPWPKETLETQAPMASSPLPTMISEPTPKFPEAPHIAFPPAAIITFAPFQPFDDEDDDDDNLGTKKNSKKGRGRSVPSPSATPNFRDGNKSAAVFAPTEVEVFTVAPFATEDFDRYEDVEHSKKQGKKKKKNHA